MFTVYIDYIYEFSFIGVYTFLIKTTNLFDFGYLITQQMGKLCLILELLKWVTTVKVTKFFEKENIVS